jgi:hypothetical protein
VQLENVKRDKENLPLGQICKVSFFLPRSLSVPTHLLRWVVWTYVAFDFMPGAQKKTFVGLLLVAI